MHETITSLIDQTASRLKDKKAIIFLRKGKPESELTYSFLQHVSNRVGNALIGMGLKKGDRVILYMKKCLEQVIFHLGIQKTGAISVILNPGFKKEELTYFLEDTNAKVLVVGKNEEALVRSIDSKRIILAADTDSPFDQEKLFQKYSSQIPEPAPSYGDPALLVYTSGTTGKPKGAILTQENLMSDAKNIIHIWEISERDVLCHVLPLFHIHGLCFALHTALISGATILMCDEFSPETTIDILSRKKGESVCTVFMAVPTMYSRMIDKMGGKRTDFSHLRLLTSGSAPLLPKDFEKIKEAFGKEPLEREGMSETGMNFSNPLRGMKKSGSIGLPLPNVKTRIVDPETYKDLETDEVGEIWLKGPNVSPGYWRKLEETASAFVNGWFRTGDSGKRDKDGYYYITDRLKHIIISGGENISPKEIESIINQHPQVKESCVIGALDEKWGEKVVAAVVLRPDTTLEAKEIQDHCKKYLMDWKCPKEVFFLKDLPRNKMGKIVKEEVVKLFSNCSSVL